MKNNIIIVAALSFLSILTGYLLSAISLVGRVGIGLFYHEYRFLKSWWKGALFVFIIWTAVWVIQVLLRKKLSKKLAGYCHAIFIIVAVIGLYFSYADFRNTLSHRWLGEWFHLGVYMFWLAWIGISIFTWIEASNISIATVGIQKSNLQE